MDVNAPEANDDPRSPAGGAPVFGGCTAFITGCGRSGTTILGQILSKHPDVMYLNDRFDVWVDPLPVTDIWGQRELPRRGQKAPTPATQSGTDRSPAARVELTADDARALSDDDRERFLRRLESERQNKPLLIEKLAINNFRLGFLTALCPQASLLNIVRHGVEVARSIERKASLGQWYGLGDRKWALLCEYAASRGHGDLLPLCTTAYEKGLLEWRLSVEAADEFYAAHPGANVLHLRYEDLIADASSVCDRLVSFLGLPPDEPMREFCIREVRRLNPAAHEREIPPTTEAIAGQALRRLGYPF